MNLKGRKCPATLRVDSSESNGLQTVAICEKAPGHKGKHKCMRVSRRDLFVTIEWDKDCTEQP